MKNQKQSESFHQSQALLNSLRPHHARAFRKRHLLSLIAAIAVFSSSLASVATLAIKSQAATKLARSTAVSIPTVNYSASNNAGTLGYRSWPGASKPELKAGEVKGQSVQSFQDQQLLAVARTLPAVVKIYHLVCGELIILSHNLGNGCAGATGSGFFVSEDGYIATNGHVVSMSARDIVVNSPDLLLLFLQAKGVSPTQAQRTMNNPESLAALKTAIYKLPEQQVFFRGEQHHYAVALSEHQLEFDEQDLVRGGVLKETGTVKLATLEAINYDSKELTTGEFEHSDVALIKIKGANFPVVSLGNVNGLAQGAALTVVGFPGSAENGLTDKTVLKASATTGIVSAIRAFSGSNRKSIQSDVKIGYGNSGGPALDSEGRVVGIATYSFASGEAADGSISYMRDIDDLLELADNNDIQLGASSHTQAQWEEGLKLFFEARYSRAIAKFNEVKQLYPMHTLASEYTNLARIKIASGEEAQDTSTFFILLGAVSASAAAALATTMFIIRHSKRHQLYEFARVGLSGRSLLTRFQSPHHLHHA